MRIIITGGICTGKSTAYKIMQCALLKFDFLSIDEVVAELYKDPTIQKQLTHDLGTCDKAQISDMAFEKIGVMEVLEGIFNPIIFGTLQDFIDSHEHCVIEFPLYYKYFKEVGELLDHDFHVIWVESSYETKCKRAATRGISEEKLKAILYSQKDEWIARAMCYGYGYHRNVITMKNNGSYGQLVLNVHESLNYLIKKWKDEGKLNEKSDCIRVI